MWTLGAAPGAQHSKLLPCPRQSSARGFQPNSWGLGMPKSAPRYLSAIRSTGNRHQVSSVGRSFKHQEGWQNPYKTAWCRGSRRVTHNPSNGRAQFAPLGWCDASLHKEGPRVTGADRNREKLVLRLKSSDQSRQGPFNSILPPALSGSKHQPAVYSPSPKVQRVRCEHSQ